LTVTFDKSGEVLSAKTRGHDFVLFIFNGGTDKTIDYVWTKPIVNLRTCIYDLDQDETKG